MPGTWKRRLLAGVLLLAGCSQQPRLRPVNEINEPVFSRANYLAAQATLGGQVVNDDRGDTYEPALLFEPGVILDVNVNPWAGYTVWPLYWNFLLTGEQYRDSVSLKVRKLNLSTSLGISGLGYSAREGWYFSGSFGIRVKYLASERVFLQWSGSLDLHDFRDTDRGIGSGETGLGYQLDGRNSFRLSHRIAFHRIEERGYYPKHGIRFFDGDIQNEFRLGHSLYFGRSHVLGPELGFGFLDARLGQDDYYLVGIKYRYVSW